jgi:ABC-type glutathione transport system ATPase component
MAISANPLLHVSDLSVAFDHRGQSHFVVTEVALQVAEGEAIAIVGESGSGKTLTCLAMLGLLRGATVCGRLRWQGVEFDMAQGEKLATLRGRNITMLPQHFASAFNPFRNVGAQMTDVIRLHHGGTMQSAMNRAAELLAELGIDSPNRRLHEYAHQQSGGILQRIALATALSCEPQLLIADEMTSALDVTSQHLLLEQLEKVRASRRIAVILVSHNLAVVGRLAERVYVFGHGRVVEQGTVQQILTAPCSEDTIRLVHAAKALALP